MWVDKRNERTYEEHELLCELRVVGCGEHDLVAVGVFLDVITWDPSSILMLVQAME
jgi:hypothetical protein